MVPDHVTVAPVPLGQTSMAKLSDCRMLPDLLRQQARERPNATAQIFGDRETSYGELDRRANQVANGLLALGVQVQQRIGYLGKNSDLYFELLFGAAAAGAVLVPVNWRLAPPEMTAILSDAEVTVLFVRSGFAAVVASLELPPGIRVFSLDGANPSWPDFAAWRDASPSHEPGSRVQNDDTALQLYTSGTTGLPKGVELTHRNYIAYLISAQSAGWGDVGSQDVALLCMPVFHVAGTNLGLIALSHGCKTVIMEEVDVDGIIEAISEHRVTFLILVPAVILLLVQHPRSGRADFSTVRTLAYGASPIAEDLLKQAGALLGNTGFWHLYGLTEATAAGTVSPPAAHDPALGKLRSCGRPVPDVALRIVGADGATLPPGQVGEVVIRSPCVMKGYWKNPRATRAAMLEGGWLRTGDAAYMDEDGFVYIHDRVKDMIVTGGENVYPAEVENALFGHPAVADVAVIGVPDARWGEAVKAIVVLRPDASATAEAIIARARARIAGYKLPKSIDFVDALPRNPTGKVLRRELRAPYWRGHERQIG